MAKASATLVVSIGGLDRLEQLVLRLETAADRIENAGRLLPKLGPTPIPDIDIERARGQHAGPDPDE